MVEIVALLGGQRGAHDAALQALVHAGTADGDAVDRDDIAGNLVAARDYLPAV